MDEEAAAQHPHPPLDPGAVTREVADPARVADTRDLARDRHAPLDPGAVTREVADPARVADTRDLARDRPEPPAPQPRRIGEFEVHSLLGRGGMGAVYRAWHPALRRHVALKFMSSRPSPDRLARFAREGELAAALDHPGVVRVYSAGEADGSPYLVCELVEGCRTLDAVLPALDLRRRVELVRDAARALGHAHERGVVHRDVKPDNLLVDAAGTLRVTDFGLATGRDVERLTASGSFVGTLGYTPPEQLSATADGIGPRADVWALGVVLYQALTGTLPFEATSVQRYIYLVLAGEPPPPSARAPSVDRALDAICLRALALRPVDRYAEGDALADALDGWLRGESSPRARRWPVTLLAAVALAAVVAAMIAASSRPALVRPPAVVVKTTPTTVPGARVPPPSPDEDLDAAYQLRRLERLVDPAQRLEAVRDWLARWPSARDRELALQLERRTRPLVPIRLESPRRTVEVRFLDDQRLVVGAADGVTVRDAATGRELARLSSLAMTTRGRLGELPGGGAVIIDGNHVIVVASDAKVLGELRLDRAVSCAAVSADGRILAAGLDSGVTQVVTLPDGRLLARLESRGLPVHGVALSRSGRWAATGCGLSGQLRPADVDNAARLWDLTTGTLVKRLPLESRVNSLEFLRDGDAILLGTSGGRVLRSPTDRLAPDLAFTAIGVEDGAMLSNAHTGGVDVIVASADGRRAYTIADGELRAWDVETGRERYAVVRARDLETLDLSPDETRLVTCASDGVVEVWATE